MKVKNSYFSRYLGYKLLKHKVLLIVSLVANILALPLMAIITSSTIEGLYNLVINSTEQSRKSYEFETAINQFISTSESAFLICVLVFGVIAVISLITPTILMSYNHRRSDSDMYLSLPISEKSRFFADAIVGAIISLLPLILNFLGGLIFIGKGADIISKYETIVKGVGIPGIAELTICYPYDFFIFSATIGIIAVIGIYFSSLFFASCTGKRISSIIFSLLVPATLVGIGIYLSFLVKRTAYGIIEWEAIEMIPGYIAPFGMLKLGWDKFYYALFRIGHEGAQVLDIPLSIIITHIATSVLFFFGAYFCTIKRKAENVGRLFAIEIIYKITITLFIAFALSFIVSSTAYDYSVNIPGVVIGLIIALAIYLAIQLPHYKNIKKLPKLLLHFGVTAAVFFTIFVGIAFSDAFGMARYVPTFDEIESIEVDNFVTGIQSENIITLTDKKDIELVTSLHRKCVQQKYGTGYMFTINYKLKNGEKVLRSYIDSSEGTGQYIAELRRAMLTSATAVEQALPKEEGINDISGTFIVNDKGTIRADRLSENGMKALLDAIRLDSKAGTLVEGEAIGTVGFAWTNEDMEMFFGGIYVREGMENILKVLRDELNYESDEYLFFYSDTSKVSPEDRIYAVIGDRDYDFRSKSQSEYFLYIRNKDLENEKVKELMSLIDFGEYGHDTYDLPYVAEFGTVDAFIGLTCGIKAEDMEKASALIAEIKADREKNNDKVDFSGFGFYMW